MKCITIYQPWAQLVVIGAKRHETRTWQPKHRGPLLIHAGRRFVDAARDISVVEPFRSPLFNAGFKMASDLPLGTVVGVVEVIDCKDTEEIREQLLETERSFGDFRNGRWAWLLGAPRMFSKPIMYQGKQGLFEVPDALVADELAKLPQTEGAELKAG